MTPAARLGALGIALALGAVLSSATAPEARQFRVVQPILRPAALPRGAERVFPANPIDRRVVRSAVESVVGAWYGGDLETLLDERFANRSRLLDTIAEVVPRDARLRILSIRGISTLDQFRQRLPGGGMRLVSTISAVVRTQLEFNDPSEGFQRLAGTNEFIFRVEERLREPVPTPGDIGTASRPPVPTDGTERSGEPRS